MNAEAEARRIAKERVASMDIQVTRGGATHHKGVCVYSMSIVTAGFGALSLTATGKSVEDATKQARIFLKAAIADLDTVDISEEDE